MCQPNFKMRNKRLAYVIMSRRSVLRMRRFSVLVATKLKCAACLEKRDGTKNGKNLRSSLDAGYPIAARTKLIYLIVSNAFLTP